MTGPAMPRVRSAAVGHVVVTVLLVVVALYGCFLLVNGVGAVARGGDRLVGTLPVEAQISPETVPLPAGLALDQPLATELEVTDPTTGQAALALAIDVARILYFVAFLWIVRGFAASLRHREPFGPGNVRRLRTIAVLLLVGAPLLEAIETGLGTLLFRQVDATAGVTAARYEVPEGALLIGLLMLVLSQVFALGVRLREDSEGTI